MVPSCVYCLNCTKFSPLILRNIIKSVATKRHILRLKCTKFAPADPLAGFKGPTSKQREGRERRERGEKERGGNGREEGRGEREGERKGRKGKGCGPPPMKLSSYASGSGVVLH